MNSTTVRISASSRDSIRAVAQSHGLSMQAALEKAIEAYRRQCFLDAVNQGYDLLKKDATAWSEELAEREAWDGVLEDGLDEL